VARDPWPLTMASNRRLARDGAVGRRQRNCVSLSLAAVFPRGIVYDERHYRSAISGFDDFQDHDGVIAVIFAGINEFTLQICAQIFQDGGESFPLDERLAI
jgi:hypothetical protein